MIIVTVRQDAFRTSGVDMYIDDDIVEVEAQLPINYRKLLALCAAEKQTRN